MEHLLFHWEDIVEVLIDDLITEEVNERNTIEAKLNGEQEYKEEEQVIIENV